MGLLYRLRYGYGVIRIRQRMPGGTRAQDGSLVEAEVWVWGRSYMTENAQGTVSEVVTVVGARAQDGSLVEVEVWVWGRSYMTENAQGTVSEVAVEALQARHVSEH
jgi:hypothetical protein